MNRLEAAEALGHVRDRSLREWRSLAPWSGTIC